MESSPIKRRLAAILAADAVGYSAHMARDEEGTLRTLGGHRRIIDGLIVDYGGRIVGTAGDSVLAEFPSSVEAVRCAVEIQQSLATRNNSLAEPDRLLFRIGINLGDVIVEGNDILGDGVNVAARLESIAEPGGICVASSVYDQISGKLNLGFADMGDQSLKNIARPVRAFRIDRHRPADGAPSAAPARGRNTTVVWAGAAAAIAVVAAAGLFVFGQSPRPTSAPAVAQTAPATTQPAAPPAVAAPAAPVQPAPAPAAAAPTMRAQAVPLARHFTGGTADVRCDASGDDMPAGQGVARVNGDTVLVNFPAPGGRGSIAGQGQLQADGSLALEFVRVGRGAARGARQGGPASRTFSGRLVDGRGTLTGPQGRCSLALALN